jgi:hypothetical protein
MDAYVSKGCILFKYWPHEEPDIKEIPWRKFRKAFMAKWTSQFDCENETQFWYCIKDDEFDVSKIKAKRRYEITRGNKNYCTRVIDPDEYKDALYSVYIESLGGYEEKVRVKSRTEFDNQINAWKGNDACVLFGTFSRTEVLCGYCDVYKRGRYLPISSLKTVPECERDGVNFALISFIVDYFSTDIKHGSYLCDGARNSLHKTNFQDFLIKYFGFRRAYCVLHIEYRGVVKYVISILFPFRKLIKRCPGKLFHYLYSVLKMEAWKRGEPE